MFPRSISFRSHSPRMGTYTPAALAWACTAESCSEMRPMRRTALRCTRVASFGREVRAHVFSTQLPSGMPVVLPAPGVQPRPPQQLKHSSAPKVEDLNS